MRSYTEALCDARNEADRLGKTDFYLFFNGGDWEWALDPRGYGPEITPTEHYALEPSGAWFRTGLPVNA